MTDKELIDNILITDFENWIDSLKNGDNSADEYLKMYGAKKGSDLEKILLAFIGGFNKGFELAVKITEIGEAKRAEIAAAKKTDSLDKTKPSND